MKPLASGNLLWSIPPKNKYIKCNYQIKRKQYVNIFLTLEKQIFQINNLNHEGLGQLQDDIEH